jgi:hypothetical protein
MKKVISFVTLLVFLLGAVACQTTSTTTTTTATTATTTATTTTTTTVAPQGVITWSGLGDAEIVRGDLVDLLEGITATDSIDGDITADIDITDDDLFSSSLAGGYVVTYSVTNSTGVTSTRTKNFTVLVAHNVANGDFTIPSYGWNLDIPGGSATLNAAGGNAVVTISNPGNAWWAIQLYQTNVHFKAGETYKLTLKASSTTGYSLAAGYENIDGGYAMLNPGFQVIELDATMQEYVVYYTAMEDYSNIKAVIYLGYKLPTDVIGEANHVITIDDINIEIVEPAQSVVFSGIEDVIAYSGGVNFNALSGVTAMAGAVDVTNRIEVLGIVPNEIQVASEYFVTYVVTLVDGTMSFATRKIQIRLAKNHEYETANGNFDNGLSGWTQDVNQTNGTGAATFVNNGDGTVSITVTNVSNASWHIQMYQGSSNFKAGESYVVTITLKASAERNVIVEVVDPSAGFASVAPALVNVPVGTEWVTYEIHFTADKDYNNIKLGLLLGNGDGVTPNGITVTVDRFQVYKYDAFNENLTTTNTPWVYDNIVGEFNLEGNLVVTFVATGAEGKVAGGAPWNNQLYQSSGSTLIVGHTYEIEVRLRSTVNRVIRAWMEDVNRGYAGIANDGRTELTLVANEWGILTYTITITPETATTNAKYVIMFGDGAIAGVAHQIEIDYFKITDVTNVIPV